MKIDDEALNKRSTLRSHVLSDKDFVQLMRLMDKGYTATRVAQAVGLSHGMAQHLIYAFRGWKLSKSHNRKST